MKANYKVTMKQLLSAKCPPELRFIESLEHAALLVSQLREAGYDVGIVGGVWDLPHIGHAKYLFLAKEECDFLIVVVDSDELVRSRKGPTRPVIPEAERIQMVCHLASADMVILRKLKEHQEDKEYLNKKLSPDVCILSTSTGDIPPAQREIIAQYVKRVKVFPPQAETSSGARIRLLAIDGATPLAEAITKLIGERTAKIAEILASLPKDVQVAVEVHMQKLKEL